MNIGDELFMKVGRILRIKEFHANFIGEEIERYDMEYDEGGWMDRDQRLFKYGDVFFGE